MGARALRVGARLCLRGCACERVPVRVWACVWALVRPCLIARVPPAWRCREVPTLRASVAVPVLVTYNTSSVAH